MSFIPTGNLTEAASQLYNALHKLDQLHLDVLIAERFPDYGLGEPLMTARKGNNKINN
jgi:L-threonylcarbamoyladenylate synthase